MAEIATATVKVLPDLTEFEQILAAIPKVGLTICETTEYTRYERGEVIKTVKTTSVVKGT